MSKKENLTEQVYESLKHKIINNEILPNTYLDEKQICEDLGVSRTPVREALVKLEWEGLVTSLPQRGIIVSDLSLQTIIELIQIRKVMEPLLLKPYLHCCSKDILTDFRQRIELALGEQNYDMLRTLDYEFHRYLYEACNKRHVRKLLAYVSDQFQRIRTQEFYLQQRSISGAYGHIEIIDAMLAEDFDRASDLMYEHVRKAEQTYCGILLNEGPERR